MFAFNHNTESDQAHAFCGISDDQAKRMIDAIETCFNESLDLSIKERFENEDGDEGMKVHAPVSIGELAQAAAEVFDELTPEISFMIGICVYAEMQNRERHIHYMMMKYGPNQN